MCKDIFTCAGRQEQLPSSTMFVVKSYINNWNENTSEFVKSLLDDESFHVVARTRGNEKIRISMVDPLGRLITQSQIQAKEKEHIIGVEIDWVMSDKLENHLEDTSQLIVCSRPAA